MANYFAQRLLREWDDAGTQDGPPVGRRAS